MCLDLIHLTKKLFPAIEDNSLLNPPAHTQAAGIQKPSWKCNDVSSVSSPEGQWVRMPFLPTATGLDSYCYVGLSFGTSKL